MAKFYKFLSSKRVGEYVKFGKVGPDYMIGGWGYESPEASNALLRKGDKLALGTRGRLLALVCALGGACGYTSETINDGVRELALFMEGWGLGFYPCAYQWDDTEGASATNKVALEKWWREEVDRVCEIARTVLNVKRKPEKPLLSAKVQKNETLMAMISRIEGLRHNGLRALCEAWWLYNCDTEKFPSSRLYFGWKDDDPLCAFSYAKKYVQCVCLRTNTEHLQGDKEIKADPNEPVIGLVTRGYWEVKHAEYVLVNPYDSISFLEQMKDEKAWRNLSTWKDG